MLVKLVLIAIVMVIIGLIALRFARSNSIERSISWHRRRLGSIQGIVERTAERNTHEGEQALPASEEHRIQPPVAAHLSEAKARAEIDISENHRVNSEGRLVFGDLSITPVKPPVPPIYERRSRRPRPSKNGGEHFRVPGEKSRKLLPIAGIVVVLLAIGSGVFAYAHSRSHNGAPARSTSTSVPRTVSHPPITIPTKPVFQLLSSTSSSATFRAPSGRYQVKVTVGGPCWLGFKHQAADAKWLATPTIGRGGVDSFSLSLSGQLALVIGNTPYLKSISVNGTPLVLPKLPTYGYNIILK